MRPCAPFLGMCLRWMKRRSLDGALLLLMKMARTLTRGLLFAWRPLKGEFMVSKKDTNPLEVTTVPAETSNKQESNSAPAEVNEKASCGGTFPKKPSSSSIKRCSWRGTARNGVVLVCMVAVFCWNMGNVGVKSLAPPESLRFLTTVVHIDQMWNMFSPRPPDTHWWYIIESTLFNRSKIELHRLDHSQSHSHSPKWYLISL